MTAEQRLAHLDEALARIQSIEAGGVAAEEVSFGLTETAEEIVERFHGAIERLSRFAAVETAVDSDARVRTVIGWTGDFTTVCAGAVRADQLSAHFAALRADVQARARVISLVATAAQAAASVCIALGSPIAVPVAIRNVAKLATELQSALTAFRQ